MKERIELLKETIHNVTFLLALMGIQLLPHRCRVVPKPPDSPGKSVPVTTEWIGDQMYLEYFGGFIFF